MVKARNNISMSSIKSKKSKELRKYEIAYHKCIKMGMKSRDCKKTIKKLRPKTRKRLRKSLKRSIKTSIKRRSRKRRTRTRSRKRTRSKRTRSKRSRSKRSRSKRSHTKRSRSKRPLNSYQKFVRKESSKSIYKGQSARSRMRAISKLWKRSRN
jgi:hypothetical protein